MGLSITTTTTEIVLFYLILLIYCQQIATQRQSQQSQQSQLQLQPLNHDGSTNVGDNIANTGKYPINTDNQIRYDAPDDCRYRIVGSDEVALTCNLRTVNSEFDTTNFSVIPSEHTVSLSVICNDEIMAKSSLKPRSFSHLTRLKELSMEYCKIAKFSQEVLYGLNELRNLTIRTHNINWPALNFDIETDSFGYVKNLDRLDLSQNNIWSLPENIFCAMSGLTFLNISENRLQDMNELGFRDRPKDEQDSGGNKSNPSNVTDKNKVSGPTSATTHQPCSIDLEVLDASHNHFVLLPANGFGVLRRLKYLKLDNNEISMVADRALSGLKNLQILNLSSNKIVALPSELFTDPAGSIQEVYLQNNSISVLSPKLFSNLEQLQALDLSANQITSTWIDRNTFVGLIRLVLLNLSHNKITKLDQEIFADLYTLQILNLQHNQLENIAADTFSPMNNLHTLLLSHNRLTYLDGYALNGLYVLSLLSLDNNALIGVHPEAFRNCSSLQDLNLNGNQLKQVPLALRNMRLLRTVDLGENMIPVLEESGFRGLTNLYGIRLIGNYLENITVNAFKDLPNLQILNLARNRIQYVEPGAFETTTSIQAIRLDNNELTDISGLFANMPSLLWLNISNNHLEHFDYSQIPAGLQWLDIHKNDITELSNRYERNNLRLQTLDASFNRLVRVTPSSIPNSIELLFLNDNLIQVVEPHTFLAKENLTRVDLYANQITTLDIKALRLMPVYEHPYLPEFYIGGNPFLCDCNIDWLQRINHISTRQLPRIMDLETIYCKLLNVRERAYIPLIDAEQKHFLCTYTQHCFALCHCCDRDKCDCEMNCPNNCTCFHDQTWATNIVECSSAGYSEMPPKIPIDTTELYIDGNDLIELTPQHFIGRKNLVVLYVNNSNLQLIHNTTFNGLTKLSLLHLEDNKLQRFAGNEFTGLEGLKELYLQNNRISYITNKTFLSLRKLEVLRLDGNKLIQFEVWQLALNPYLVEIGLADNMWSCECSYLSRFSNYLQQSAEKIIDANRIACIYNNLTSILREKNGTKCTLRDGISTYVRTSEIEDLLPLLLAATCAFIGFFGLILGIFCYRHELSMWAHTNCLLSVCYKSTNFVDTYDKDRLTYDAYITYSRQDEHFVNQILANTLENDVGYRLCLHYRDFNVNSYVADAIIEAAETSKQAVLVLSKHFLYNEWTRFEYKSAIHEIIKRRRRLIFVLYGDLPQRDIDADMRHYLRTNTCIEWDDKKFWQKLRIALPHIRKNHCLAKRSALNIYATAHDYGAPPPPPSSTTTVRNDCTKRFDCNNYATINDCGRNYNFDGISGCKYNTNQNILNNDGQQQQHQQQQQQQQQTLSNHHLLNNKNDYNIKSLERKHEYAVPANCLIGSSSNYSLGGFDRNSPGDNSCECCPSTARYGGGGGGGGGGGSSSIGGSNTVGCASSSDCNRSLSNSVSVCGVISSAGIGGIGSGGTTGGGGGGTGGGGGSAGSGSINLNFTNLNTHCSQGGLQTAANSIFNYTKSCNCTSSKCPDDGCRCNRYESNGSLSDVNSIDRRLPQALWA